jgi:hypothetical protein
VETYRFAWRKSFRIYSFSDNNEIIYLKNYIRSNGTSYSIIVFCLSVLCQALWFTTESFSFLSFFFTPQNLDAESSHRIRFPLRPRVYEGQAAHQ